MTPIQPITELIDFIKVWTPLLTAGGFIYGIYRSSKKNISEWADKMMNNHMSHLQASLERIDETQNQQLKQLSAQTENLTAQTVLLDQISRDLRPQVYIQKRAKYRSGKMKKGS